jgi:hypothetical protein
MRLLAATSVAVLLVAPAAHAQNQEELARKKMAEAAAQGDIVNLKRTVELARVPLEAPVKGAPYSADVIVSNNQTLADGNRISHSDTSHVYRDGEGRTRREQSGTMSVVTRTEPVITTRSLVISIVDPVAGYSYSLDTEHKIAWRTPIGASKELLDKVTAAAAQRSSQPMSDEQKARMADELKKLKAEEDKLAAGGKERAAPSSDAPSKASAEVIARSGGRGGWTGYAYTPSGPLEHATIDGLAVEGRKTSETIPAGQIGNEQPIVITSEEWRSTDLKVLVLTKHNDPRTGESIYRLTNVVRAEPDPSLFMVPPGYDVRDTNIRRNNE